MLQPVPINDLPEVRDDFLKGQKPLKKPEFHLLQNIAIHYIEDVGLIKFTRQLVRAYCKVLNLLFIGSLPQYAYMDGRHF